jgi:hypothetical protein
VTLAKVLRKKEIPQSMKYRVMIIKRLQQEGLSWKQLVREYENLNQTISDVRMSIKKIKYKNEKIHKDKFICILCNSMFENYDDAIYHSYVSHFSKISISRSKTSLT